MGTWQLQEAKARLSQLIDSAETEGPQIITRRGVKTAVVLPFEAWERAQPRRRSLLEVLQSGPQFEIPLPKRGTHKHRATIKS